MPEAEGAGTGDEAVGTPKAVGQIIFFVPYSKCFYFTFLYFCCVAREHGK